MREKVYCNQEKKTASLKNCKHLLKTQSPKIVFHICLTRSVLITLSTSFISSLAALINLTLMLLKNQNKLRKYFVYRKLKEESTCSHIDLLNFCHKVAWMVELVYIGNPKKEKRFRKLIFCFEVEGSSITDQKVPWQDHLKFQLSTENSFFWVNVFYTNQQILFETCGS